jgi:hypothetical protein
MRQESYRELILSCQEQLSNPYKCTGSSPETLSFEQTKRKQSVAMGSRRRGQMLSNEWDRGVEEGDAASIPTAQILQPSPRLHVANL